MSLTLTATLNTNGLEFKLLELHFFQYFSFLFYFISYLIYITHIRIRYGRWNIIEFPILKLKFNHLKNYRNNIVSIIWDNLN